MSTYVQNQKVEEYMPVPTAKIMCFFPSNVFIYKQRSLTDLCINADITKHMQLKMFDISLSFITNIAV